MKSLCGLVLALLLLLPALAPAAEQDLVDTLGPLMTCSLRWTEVVEGWQLEFHPDFTWKVNPIGTLMSFGYDGSLWENARLPDNSLWEERPDRIACIGLEVYLNGECFATWDQASLQADRTPELVLPCSLFYQSTSLELRGDYVLTYARDPDWSREVHLTLGPAPLVPPQRKLPDYSSGQLSPYTTTLRMGRPYHKGSDWVATASVEWGAQDWLFKRIFSFATFPTRPARVRATLNGEEVALLEWPAEGDDLPAQRAEFSFVVPPALVGKAPVLAAELEVWKPDPNTGEPRRVALQVTPVTLEVPPSAPVISVYAEDLRGWPRVKVQVRVDPPNCLLTVNDDHLETDAHGSATYHFNVPTGTSRLVFEARRAGVEQTAIWNVLYSNAGLRLRLERTLIDLDAGQHMRGVLTTCEPCYVYVGLNDVTHRRNVGCLFQGHINPDKPVEIEWDGQCPGPYGTTMPAPAGDYLIGVDDHGNGESNRLRSGFNLAFRVESSAPEPDWYCEKAANASSAVKPGPQLRLTLPELRPYHNSFWYGVKSGGLTYHFTGIRAEFQYARIPDGGRARVFVDGQQVDVLTFHSYLGGLEYPLRWSTDQLPSGDHVLYVEPLQPDGDQPLLTPIAYLCSWRAQEDIQHEAVDWKSGIGFEPTFGPEPIDSDTYFDRVLEFPEAP